MSITRFMVLAALLMMAALYGEAQGVQLNNLVNELINVAGPDSSGTNYGFTVTRSGWVYIGNQGSDTVTLTSGGAPETLLLETEYDGARETMRYLAAGAYQISAARAEGLVVREIADLIHCHYPGDGRVLRSASYSGSRARRDVFKHVNELWWWGGAEIDPFLGQWKDSGRRWLAQAHIDPTTLSTVAEMEDFIKNTRGFVADPNEYFGGTLIDEFGNIHGNYDLWAQAILNLKAPGSGYEDKTVYLFCGPELPDDAKGRALLNALMSTGGAAVVEIYLAEEATEAGADSLIQTRITDVVANWKSLAPGSEKHMIICPLPTDMLDYMADKHPNVNFKKFLDKQFQAVATNAACAGVRGYSAWTMSYASPEVARYTARMWRHYGIEGASTAYCGKSYTLDHVQDGDFASGGAHWTVTAGSSGTTRFETIANYGQHQGRWSAGTTGNTALVMTRSLFGINECSQTITNLTPGEMYSFRMITTDYAERYDPCTIGDRHRLNISISDAEIADSRTIPYLVNTGGAEMVVNFHWRVFEAQASTATLTIRDWENDSTPPIDYLDQQLVYNYVQVQPYFEAEWVDPIGAWAFNENSGNVTADVSGYYTLDEHVNDANFPPTVTWAETGTPGNYCIYFPGQTVDDKVLCGKGGGTTYDWYLTERLSMEVWFKGEEAWDGGELRTIFGKGRDEGAIIRLGGFEAWLRETPTVSTTLAPGKWHHAVMTWDGTIVDGNHVANLKLYKDGQLAGERAHVSRTSGAGVLGCALEDYHYTGGTLKGWIDECRIYDEAIPAEQVLANFETGPTLRTPTTCSEVVEQGQGLAMDYNGDCVVSIEDFAFFAGQWLSCMDPDDPACDTPWWF